MAETLGIIDFAGYEDVVDSCQLRTASSYGDAIKTALNAKPGGAPSMFSTKLRSGIEFRPGELTCWAGYNGHRKSLFTGQVVLDLVSQKRRVLMASFEMMPAQTLGRMVKQAWASKTPRDDQIATFGRWTDGKLWIFDHIGRITPSKCLAMCRYFADIKMGHQVVIDSMMMVCKSEESMDEQKQFVTDLVRMAQETQMHVHLVTHCRKPSSDGETRPPSKYDLRGSAAISDQAHNVVTVWANKLKKAKQDEGDPSLNNEPDALVTVEKQRNGSWEGRCKLWFDDMSLRFVDHQVGAIETYAGLES